MVGGRGPVSSGPVVLFGSNTRNDVIMKQKMVSSRHARITWNGAALILEDLKSTNGTKLNGEKVQRPVTVSLGDTISFGSHQFELKAEHLMKLVEMLRTTTYFS